jgi:hypothetical protein
MPSARRATGLASEAIQIMCISQRKLGALRPYPN